MILPWIYPSQKCVGSLVANHLLSSPLWHCFGLLLSSFGYQKIIRTDFFIRSMITSQPLQKGFSDNWHASKPRQMTYFVFLWLFCCHEIYFDHIFVVSFPNQPSSKTTTSSWRPLATNNLERSNSYSYNSDPKLVKHNSILKSSSWIVSWRFFFSLITSWW